MSKSILFTERKQSARKRLETQNHYLSIFYDLFMNSWKIDGIDYEQNCFILNQLWERGTVGGSIERLTNIPIFQPYASEQYDIYNFPIYARFVPLKPVKFIPLKRLKVNEEIIIMYASKSRLPIKERALYCIKKITDIEMLIDQNITSMKMPFLVTCTPEDKQKLNDIVDRILNDEDVVYTDIEDVNSIKVLITSSQYLLDKLMQYKKERENELLTYLGIDNVDIEKKEHLIVDEANANNQLIQSHNNIFKTELEQFCKDMNEKFNLNMSLKSIKCEEIDENMEDENDNI